MLTTLYQHDSGDAFRYNPITCTLECHDTDSDTTVSLPFDYDDLLELGGVLLKIGHVLKKHRRAIPIIQAIYDDLGSTTGSTFCVFRSGMFGNRQFTNGRFTITYYGSYKWFNIAVDFKENGIWVAMAEDDFIPVGQVMLAVGSVLKGGTE